METALTMAMCAVCQGLSRSENVFQFKIEWRITIHLVVLETSIKISLYIKVYHTKKKVENILIVLG